MRYLAAHQPDYSGTAAALLSSNKRRKYVPKLRLCLKVFSEGMSVKVASREGTETAAVWKQTKQD